MINSEGDKISISEFKRITSTKWTQRRYKRVAESTQGGYK
jgi:hypothetical protein